MQGMVVENTLHAEVTVALRIHFGAHGTNETVFDITEVRYRR